MVTSLSKPLQGLEDYARRVLAPFGWKSEADIYSLKRFSGTHFHGPHWQGEWRERLPVTLFQANCILQEKKEQHFKKRRLHKPKWNWNLSISLPLTNRLVFCCFGPHYLKMLYHITCGQWVSLYICDIRISLYSHVISHKGFMPGDIWFLLCSTNVCRSFP